MRLLRAGQRVARPLNCGVIRLTNGCRSLAGVGSRILALAAVAVSIGGAIAFYGSRSASPPAADVVARPARDAQTAPSDASGLTASAEDARASANVPVAETLSNQPQDPVREKVPPQPPELTLQGIQLLPPLVESESAFAAEPIDPLWASQTEAHILREIAALTARPMFTLQVECRSTICRLQVVEPDKAPPDTRVTSNGVPEGVAALAGSIRELVTRSGLESRGAMSVPNRFGSRVLVAYFARETRDAGEDALTEAR